MKTQGFAGLFLKESSKVDHSIAQAAAKAIGVKIKNFQKENTNPGLGKREPSCTTWNLKFPPKKH